MRDERDKGKIERQKEKAREERKTMRICFPNRACEIKYREEGKLMAVVSKFFLLCLFSYECYKDIL